MKHLVLFFAFLLLSYSIDLQLKPGESRIFRVKENISTVFASDPKIFDYKVISPQTIAVYSRANGYGEIKVLGGNRVILDITAHIDDQKSNFDRIVKIIEEENPGSSVKIEKLTMNGGDGKGVQGYIIRGSVPSEEARDNAYNTAAVALGLTPKRDAIRKRDAVVTSQQGVSLGQGAVSGGIENLDFLEKFTVDTLIDALVINAKRQVNVKLIVADVERSLIDKLGIDYNSGTFIVPIVASAEQLRNYSLSAIIEAIRDDQIAKVLATPNISVLSGQSASFQVTSQFTPIANTVTITGQGLASPQTPIDFGVSLTVQPKVYSKDRIVLSISQEVSNIQNIVEVNGASAANLRKRRTSSVIELADGDSFILGGLIDERDIENIRAIPFLGEIPFVGALFRKASVTRSKTELIVVATVTLTQPVKSNVVSVPTFTVTGFAPLFFDLRGFTTSSQESEDVVSLMKNIGFIK